MKIFTHISYSKWDKYRRFQFDLHSFDQNILSFENSLFSSIRKDLIKSWIFRYFPFTFYIQFILVCGK